MLSFCYRDNWHNSFSIPQIYFLLINFYFQCVQRVWQQKDINFYGHEFFRTTSGNCFRVTFISGSENLNHIIFVNLLNIYRFGENQYLINFPFKAHLQNLIPAKKSVRVHLPKLIRIWSFKFTFTGFC